MAIFPIDRATATVVQAETRSRSYDPDPRSRQVYLFLLSFKPDSVPELQAQLHVAELGPSGEAGKTTIIQNKFERLRLLVDSHLWLLTVMSDIWAHKALAS